MMTPFMKWNPTIAAFNQGEIMNITVTVREVYGIKTIYPACDTAKLLARLAGTKTLTAAALQTIKALGYTVAVAAPSI